MRFPTDPIRYRTLRARLTGAIALPLLLLAGYFAFGPIENANDLAPFRIEASSPESVPSQNSPRIDPEAFRVSLFTPLHGPSITNDAAKGSDPSKAGALDLVGITESKGVLYAALYDRGQDRLFLLKSGDTLGARTVKSVAARSIELEGQKGSQTLTLVGTAR